MHPRSYADLRVSRAESLLVRGLNDHGMTEYISPCSQNNIQQNMTQCTVKRGPHYVGMHTLSSVHGHG